MCAWSEYTFQKVNKKKTMRHQLIYKSKLLDFLFIGVRELNLVVILLFVIFWYIILLSALNSKVISTPSLSLNRIMHELISLVFNYSSLLPLQLLNFMPFSAHFKILCSIRAYCFDSKIDYNVAWDFIRSCMDSFFLLLGLFACISISL